MNKNGKAPAEVAPESSELEVAVLDVEKPAQDVGHTPQPVGTTAQDVGHTPQLVGTAAQDVGHTPQLVGTAAQDVGHTPQLVGTAAQDVGHMPQLVGTAAQDVGRAVQIQPRSTHRKVIAFDSNTSIAQRQKTARIAIETVLASPDLQARMAAQGYSAARMQQGRALCDQALSLYKQQHARYGDRSAATDARAAARAQANTTYTRHLKLAKVALRENRSAAQKLGLAGPRERALSGWLLQAQRFYTNALGDPAILGALAAFGVSEGQIADGQRQIDTVIASSVAHQLQKNAAQATKQARDVALVALNHWMRDFLAVARVALADHPQRLALLGLGGAA